MILANLAIRLSRSRSATGSRNWCPPSSNARRWSKATRWTRRRAAMAASARPGCDADRPAPGAGAGDGIAGRPTAGLGHAPRLPGGHHHAGRGGCLCPGAGPRRTLHAYAGHYPDAGRAGRHPGGARGHGRQITPQAIDCPSVEQYTAGLLLSATRRSAGASTPPSPGWYTLTPFIAGDAGRIALEQRRAAIYLQIPSSTRQACWSTGQWRPVTLLQCRIGRGSSRGRGSLSVVLPHIMWQGV